MVAAFSLATKKASSPDFPMHEESFSEFKAVFMLYAAELAHRASPGGAEAEWFVSALMNADSVAQGALAKFVDAKVRRCTFSFLTDTSTMNLVDKVLTNAWLTDEEVVYNAVIAHAALNSHKLFDAFGGPFELDWSLSVEERARRREHAAARGGPAGEEPVPSPPPDLQERFRDTWLEAQAGPRGQKGGQARQVMPPKALLQGVRKVILGCRGGAAPRRWEGAVQRFLAMCREREFVAPLTAALLRAARSRESASQRYAAVFRTFRQHRHFSGRALPPFVTYVIVRFLSVRYPRVCDWNTVPDIGDGAVRGALVLAGYAPDQARETSKEESPAAKRAGEAVMAAVRDRLQRSWRQEFPRTWEQGVLLRLDALGIAPFTMVSVEHMLCEFRKLAAGTGSGICSRALFRKLAGLQGQWASTRDHFRRLREAWANRPGRFPGYESLLARVARYYRKRADRRRTAREAAEASPEGQDARPEEPAASAARTGAAHARRSPVEGRGRRCARDTRVPCQRAPLQMGGGVTTGRHPRAQLEEWAAWLRRKAAA